MSDGLYQDLLALIEASRYAEASERLRDLREVNVEPRLRELSALLRARISLKSDANSVDPAALSTQSREPFVRAEFAFVRGLGHYHLNQMSEGAQSFEMAALAYDEAGWGEKALLSRFNALIGRMNEHPESYREDEIEYLRKLQREAHEGGFHNMMGLIRRQKSCLYQDLKRFNAAFEEAREAVAMLELYGVKSDYDLALLQAADCALDACDREAAQRLVERVAGEIDARAVFPLAFVKERLAGRRADPDAFALVTPFWRNKCQRRSDDQALPTAQWSRWSGKLELSSGQSITLRVDSLEGRLVKSLLRQGASKTLLCERLWPEECGVQHLDNRLHRLISRVNAKAPSLVRYDGQKYSLAWQVSLAR